MGNAKQNIPAWILLALLVLAIIIGMDQLLLFSLGKSQNHIFYCRLNPETCSRQLFRPHPKHGFLFDPQKMESYSTLSSSPDVEKHTDYILNENGFRLSLPGASGKKVRVNVFGDSFTFGAFLREKDQLVSDLNAASPKCEFRNYGVPGFNVLQMIGLSRDEDLVAGSDLDVFLFITDDIFERLTNRPLAAKLFGRASTPFDLSREFGMESGISFWSPPPFLAENSFLFQKLERVVDHEFWASVDRGLLAERLLGQLRGNGKPRLVFHIPIPEDYSQIHEGAWRLNPPESITKVSLGERVIEGENSFGQFNALFFREGGHPNPAGAKWIASKVMSGLKGICGPGENR